MHSSYTHKLQHDPSHAPFTGSFASTLTFAIACLVALALVCSMAIASPAWAEGTAKEAKEKVAELQKGVDATAADYNEATARVNELNAQIEENTKRLAELEVQVPLQHARSIASCRSLYKMQSGSSAMVSLILDSENFRSFLTMLDYLGALQQHYYSEFNKYQAMQKELTALAEELEKQKQEAVAQQEAAYRALREAQAARDAAQAEATARAKAEEAEAKAALEKARQQKTEVQNPDAGQVAPANKTGIDEAVNWNVDRDTFIAEWGRRIDSYMGSAPLAGYGRVFAEAAWDYGVDPRYSPAISCVESSKGRYCFKPHNAWGWGSSSWDSWEEAIWAHVGGLSRGYHYTVCVEDAKKYCPPTWESWYSKVLGQINSM